MVEFIGNGTTEEEVFEEIKIRNELAPISTFDEYLSILDEIIEEKVTFGEMNQDEDTQMVKDKLAHRFDELLSDVVTDSGDATNTTGLE